MNNISRKETLKRECKFKKRFTRVLDRLIAAARRSGGAQRYAKFQGAARGRRCCSRQPGALRLLAWAGGGGGEGPGAPGSSAKRQLC